MQQYSMTLKFISIIAILLLIASTHSQDASPQNIATDTPTPPPTDTPTPQPTPPPTDIPTDPPTPTPTTPTDQPAAPQKAPFEDYEKRIQKIRETVAKSTNLDHQFLQDKIQQVIGSMTAEQKDKFESQLSTQARVAYQKYKKAREEREKAEQEEEERLSREVKVSRSQQVLKAERDAIKDINESVASRKFTDYTFVLSANSSEDFRFTLPVEQEVAATARLLTNTEGVYGAVSEVEGEEPVWIYAYEDRDRLVAQASFYSMKGFTFTGKANSSYLLRFVNHGSSRLVTMKVTNIVTQAHVGGKLTAEDVADHRLRVRGVKNMLIMRMTQQKERVVLEGENQRKLLVGFDHYYFYNIAEIVLLGVICVIQVESIRKLLLTTSVV